MPLIDSLLIKLSNLLIIKAIGRPSQQTCCCVNDTVGNVSVATRNHSCFILRMNNIIAKHDE